jgi:alpha-1,2-glucosyltransferase
LLSYLQSSFLPFLDRLVAAETSKFRIVNLIAASLFLIWEVRRLFLLIINVREGKSNGLSKPPRLKSRWSLNELNHAAFNICLFPPLFFFYGLYYTDVVSALLVLMTYRFHLQRANKRLFLAGVASLLFRQTNIFWVAIFLGGLEVNRVLARGRPGIEFPERSTFLDVVTGSLQHACVYDPLLSKAHAEGIVILE